MRYVRTVAPATPLVSLATAKAHVRTLDDDEDVRITALAAAAEQHLDGYFGILGRALVTQTWRLEAEAPECGSIKIELPPVVSISSVQYYASGVLTTWDSANYRLEHCGPTAFVTAVDGASWPSADSRKDAWRVTFVCGYGASGAVPEPLKQAALLLLDHWYTNRSAVVIGDNATELPMAVAALISPYRTIHI